MSKQKTGPRYVWILLAMTLLTQPLARLWCQELDRAGHFNFPLVSCAWPYLTMVSDPPKAGQLNVFYPDTSAKYWTTPYLSIAGGNLVIRGKFLKSRFLSINTYDRNGNSVDGIADKDFTTVSGQNPYAVPGASSSDDTFQVTVVPQPKMKDGENPPKLPPGEIYGPPPSDFFASQGYVIFRSYVDAEPGGIMFSELPDITVTIAGKDTTVAPCEQPAPSLRLLTIIILERLAQQFADNNGGFTQNASATPRSGDNGGSLHLHDQPTAPEATFVPPAGAVEGTFPNDFNKYVGAWFTYQSGRILVVRGKAAKIPVTANGYPQAGSGEQMRYWSMCNNDKEFPYPVIQCMRDEQVNVDPQGYYTFVVAAAQDMPNRVDPTVTNLDWGSTRVPDKALILRNMLPTDGFNTTTQSVNENCVGDNATASCAQQQMGEYYPQAVYCRKSVYDSGGWQACQAASAMNKNQ